MNATDRQRLADEAEAINARLKAAADETERAGLRGQFGERLSHLKARLDEHAEPAATADVRTLPAPVAKREPLHMAEAPPKAP